MTIHSFSTAEPIIPREGWHVLHLFFHIDYVQWNFLAEHEQASAREYLAHLIQEIRSIPETQLLIFSIIGGKADLGFMLTCRDLQILDRCAKQLTLALGPGILQSAFSWFSMTELSEYATSETEYAENLKRDEKLTPDSPELEKKLAEFRARSEKYNKDRLYPNLADWPVLCFYPMSKRRNPGQNWYALDLESRKKFMAGHAKVGRTYAGRIRQLITGSTGLDNGEWGVTLFARNTSDVKAIVYEMRFDPVSAEYAEFGEFFLGLQLPLNELLERLSLISCC